MTCVKRIVAVGKLSMASRSSLLVSTSRMTRSWWRVLNQPIDVQLRQQHLHTDSSWQRLIRTWARYPLG